MGIAGAHIVAFHAGRYNVAALPVVAGDRVAVGVRIGQGGFSGVR